LATHAISRNCAVIVVALLVSIVFVVYRKVRGRYKANAYQRLEEGEGGAVGDAGFSKKFEQVARHDIKMGPRIGKGSFAEVFKARWRGTVVAVKKLPAHSLTPDFFDDFEREAALMKRLRHPNVLLYLGMPSLALVLLLLLEQTFTTWPRTLAQAHARSHRIFAS
jgi:hypothetical protein